MRKYVFAIIIFLLPLSSFASIAIDSSNTSEINPNTTLSIAHTTTGDNRLMLVGVHNQGGNLITGITYDSVAFTEIYRMSGSGSNYHSLWYLKNPNTGLHNVVITMSGSSYIGAGVVTYTGVDLDQDFLNYDFEQVTGTSATISLTTEADNSMLFGYGDVVSGALSGSGDTDIVEAVGTGGFTSLLANTTTGSIGSYDFIIAGTSSVLTTAIALEIQEAVAVTPVSTSTAMFYHNIGDSHLSQISVWYMLILLYFGLTFLGFMVYGVFWAFGKMFKVIDKL